jgi:hypothetical protein
LLPSCVVPANHPSSVGLGCGHSTRPCHRDLNRRALQNV